MAAVVDESITVYREINQDYKESVSLLVLVKGMTRTERLINTEGSDPKEKGRKLEQVCVAQL